MPARSTRSAPACGATSQPRRYTITIVNGTPADTRAPPNTIYTLAEPGAAIGMHMRNYVPDRSIDWTGGVGVPKVELQLADGKVLSEQEACAATDAPRRGKQVPVTVSKKLWLALNSLPWRPADRTPAANFEVAPMVKFYNREHLIVDTFFPLIPSDGMAVEKGGFWSNPVTRYGFTYLSQAYGKVYVVHGKMPSTPRTWDGDPAPMNQDADMRYWSLCTSTAPPIGNTVDCVTDENVRPIVDKQGNYSVVVSRATERPVQCHRKVRRDLDGIRHRRRHPGWFEGFWRGHQPPHPGEPEVPEQLVQRQEGPWRSRGIGLLPAASDQPARQGTLRSAGLPGGHGQVHRHGQTLAPR